MLSCIHAASFTFYTTNIMDYTMMGVLLVLLFLTFIIFWYLICGHYDLSIFEEFKRK